jgi:hypothetical protein
MTTKSNSVPRASLGLFDNIAGIGYDLPGRSLGGGINGRMPQHVVDQDYYDEMARTRFSLVQAWNTKYVSQNGSNEIACTPFRAVTNSGDIKSRSNYSCGGPCQTFQSRPGLNGLSTHFGAIQDHCDGSGVPPASCNVKYVYDSSNYTTYLKQQAINKNYNDRSFGGNRNSAQQSAYRAVRRY